MNCLRAGRVSASVCNSVKLSYDVSIKPKILHKIEYFCTKTRYNPLVVDKLGVRRLDDTVGRYDIVSLWWPTTKVIDFWAFRGRH
jgi:hypothetical protein